MSDQDVNINMILIGDASVGKTTLIERFMSGEFNQNTRPTIGADFVKKEMTFNKMKCSVRFWDTAGQEKYRSMADKFYQKANGCLIVYDVCSAISFDNINFWLKNVRDKAPNDIKIMLIGNKVDLTEDRQVSTEKGIDLAKLHNIYFAETSAKENKDRCVEKAFEIVLDDISKYLAEVEKKRETEELNRMKNQLLRLDETKPPEKKCC